MTALDSQLLRFSFTGALGFLVDASVLTALVNGLDWSHVISRAVSFSAAVSLTWWINRQHVFTATPDRGSEYRRYIAVQTTGALINLVIYFTSIQIWPSLAKWPVIPLAIGAFAALMFNFIACRRFVFPSATPQTRSFSVSSSAQYTGTDNLKSMEMAHNYNNYLCAQVKKYIRGHRVFDFGAGTGTFARLISDEHIDLICIEPDESLRNRLVANGLNVASNISSVDSSADYIYSLNVLEHIEDDVDALRSIHAKLKSNGSLFIYVPAFEALYSTMDEKVGHFRRYRKSDLLPKLHKAGFYIEESRYVDSIGFLAAWAFKYIGSNDGTLSPRSVELYDRFAFPISRWLDGFFGQIFGKNLLVVAKPGEKKRAG